MKIKKEFTRISACLLALLCFWMMCVVWAPQMHQTWRADALDDDEFSGYKADKLTISVGYFGGPYYQKAVFTEAQLRALGTVKADYTFIDNMPSVVIDHVEGVRLADIMDAAGIDINSIQSFNFWTNDKKGGYYTSLTKTELIDTPRYCYYSLPDNFDTETGTGNASAGDIKERVETVLALGDNWNRCLAGGEFGSDYLNLNTNTRYRLIFGQTDTHTRTANSSAKWIHTIEVTLGGAPTVSLSDSSLEGKVGSVLHTTASVKTADSAISANGSISWSSSDSNVAKVDENGNITVTGEGSAVITASFGGASAQLTVNGSGESGKDTAGNGTGSKDAGQQDSSSDNTQRPADTTKPAGDITNPVPAKVISENDIGGVQNWRVYEMANDAAPLVPQDEDNPMLPVMGGGAIGILCAGVIGRALRFRTDLNGRKHKGKMEADKQ